MLLQAQRICIEKYSALVELNPALCVLLINIAAATHQAAHDYANRNI